MANRTALVVGATGIVGLNLAQHLADQPDWRVYGLARNPSAGGGVKERTGVVTPNENAGFDALESAGAGVPKEKPPVLAAGLVSDCAAGEPNESPVGVLAVVVNPIDVTARFSAAEGVEEAPNVNLFLAGVEGAAVAVSLAG